jgi:hypothetical protein
LPPRDLAVVDASRFRHMVSRDDRKHDLSAPFSASRTSTCGQPLVALLTKQEPLGVQRLVERDPDDILAGNKQINLRV